jgi:hypothetical protein
MAIFNSYVCLPEGLFHYRMVFAVLKKKNVFDRVCENMQPSELN